MTKHTFEDFLSTKCPDEFILNNDPSGEENWISNLDVSEVMEFAEEYGSKKFADGFSDGQVAGMNLANDVYKSVLKL